MNWFGHILCFFSQKKYHISDVGLRKICKRTQVPVPNGGRWARMPVKRVAPLKLPTPYCCEQTVGLLLRKQNVESEKITIRDLAEEFKVNHPSAFLKNFQILMS